jgi:hypothetical protein
MWVGLAASALGVEDRYFDIPKQADQPKEWERAHQLMIQDLAQAILQAIRDDDIQCLRSRIITGPERYKGEIAESYTSIPKVPQRWAEWFTGHMIAEVEAWVHAVHLEIVEKGLDPMKLRQQGRAVFLPTKADFSLLPQPVMVSARTDGRRRLVIYVWASYRWKEKSRRAMAVLHGGIVFGGVCNSWLGEEEDKIILAWDGRRGPGAEAVAHTLVSRCPSYRFVTFFQWPDAILDKYLTGDFLNDCYMHMGPEERDLMRREITFSEAAETTLNRKDHRKEFMKVQFDKDGNVDRVFLDGKEVEAQHAVPLSAESPGGG